MNFIPSSVNSLFGKWFNKTQNILQWGLSVYNTSTQFNAYNDYKRKLNVILNNPAMLKVMSLQCDLFSLGKVCVYDEAGEKIEDDPFLNFIKQPNPFQSRSQFLWDFMFWNMIGTDYCYVDSKLVDNPFNKMYHLDPSKMEWPEEFQNDADKLVFGDKLLKERGKKNITYRYKDGTTIQIPINKLVISTDLTNGIGNWYKGASRIDALYKVISNSEHALDAKNINVRYSGKFLVGSSGSLNTVGLGDAEKEDIITKMEGDKKVFPLKTLVEIKRFVENLGNLQLDQAYQADYFVIGSMFGIPRDVLETALTSSTFENQEKARMAHVSYTLQPKGNDFMDSLEQYFGYNEQKKNIVIEWEHLPFMQVFEKEKQEKKKTQIESLSLLLKEGVPLDSANQFLGTSFEIPPPEEVISDNASPETLEAQAALRGSVGGVQGILAVQQSVAMGTTTFESALSILTIVYGFTEQDAKDLLGEPTEQTS